MLGSVEGCPVGARPPARLDQAASRSAWVPIFIFAWALCCVPILVGEHPPLIDYPFHIARVAIIAKLPLSGFLQEHYQLASIFLPNLGFEAIMVPLVRMVPYTTAIDIFLALLFLATLGGAVALRQALFGRVPPAFPLVAILLYNGILLWGFLGYLVGLALMLWAVAAWIALSGRPWWVRVTVGTGFSLALFFAHLTAFGIYALVVAGLELQRAAPVMRERAVQALTGLALAACQFIPAVLVLLLFSPTGEQLVAKTTYARFSKLHGLLYPFISGNLSLDLVAGGGLIVAAGLVLVFGRARIARTLWLPLALIALAFVLMPFQFGNTSNGDTRIPLALLFLFLAGLDVSFRRAAARRATVALLASLLVIRIGWIGHDWRQRDAASNEYIAAFEKLAPESTLFAARDDRIDRSRWRLLYVARGRTSNHLADLAALRPDVFVPQVLVVPGAQPLEVNRRLEPMQAAVTDRAIPLSSQTDLDLAARRFLELRRQALPPGRAAYLVVIDEAEPRLALPAGTELVASGSNFRLARLTQERTAVAGR